MADNFSNGRRPGFGRGRGDNSWRGDRDETNDGGHWRDRGAREKFENDVWIKRFGFEPLETIERLSMTFTANGRSE